MPPCTLVERGVLTYETPVADLWPATGLVVAVTKNRFNPIEMNAFDRVYGLAAAAFGH